jgi:hypothetical protein
VSRRPSSSLSLSSASRRSRTQLAHARRLTHPDRRGEHQNVRLQQLRPDHRPLIAVALVNGHTEANVVIYHPHHVAVHVVISQGSQHLAPDEL